MKSNKLFYSPFVSKMNQQTEIFMKRILLLTAIICMQIAVIAQVRTVTGYVTSKNQPVEGVTVQIKDTDTKTQTNSDGFYKIETSEGSNVLVFQKLNMKVQEVKITKNNIDISMSLIDEENLFELSMEDLMNIDVVSASKVKQSQSSAPNIINAFSKELINNYDWLHPQDLLIAQPGFFQAQDYDRQTIGFRGQFEGWNNNHILMLVDGIPFNDNLYGSAYTWDNTPLNFSKSVEVIRGAGGALYGSNAMNGVLTLNTINASDLDGGGSIRLRGGSNNYRYIDMITGIEKENYGMVLSFSHNGTDGNEYDSYDASGRVDGDGNLMKFKTQDSRENTYFFSKIYGKDKLEGLVFQYHEQHWNYETGHGWLFVTPDRPENMKENRRIIALRYAPTNEWNNFNYDITARYQIHNIDWNMRFQHDGYYYLDEAGDTVRYHDGISEYLNTSAQDLFVRAQGSYKLGEHNFLAGIEGTSFFYNGDRAHNSNIDLNTWAYPDSTIYYYESNAWLEYLDKKTMNVAGYAQYLSPMFFNRVQLTLSGRFDKMFFDYKDLAGTGEIKSKSFEMFTPRAALVVSLTDMLKLKAIVGQAFRTPSPTEMFGYNTYTLASNLAELKPEVVTNIDLGAIWEPSSKYGFRVNLFWMNFENQIGYSIANANLSTNIYTLETAGVEVESRFSAGDLSGFANFTLANRMSETIADETITAEQSKVTWAPATTFNVGLNYKYKQLAVSAMGRYHGKMLRRQSDIDALYNADRPASEVDGWFVADMRLSYTVAKNIELGFSMKNILDSERYFIKNNIYAFDYKLGGRQMFGEIIMRF